jgi:hypothetical protein
MSKKKDTYEGTEMCTIRQFFYMNEQKNEVLIRSLERTYKEENKQFSEWVEICSNKKIIFK